MATLPDPTWADQSPAWLGELRGILREREPQEPAPGPEVNAAIEMERIAAVSWLGLRGVDAAKQFVAQFGNAPDLVAQWSRTSGIDESPSLTIVVAHQRDGYQSDPVFRYTLAIVADADGVRPRVTVQAGSNPPQMRGFGPWIRGAALTDVAVDEIAGDVTAALFEATAD